MSGESQMKMGSEYPRLAVSRDDGIPDPDAGGVGWGGISRTSATSRERKGLKPLLVA